MDLPQELDDYIKESIEYSLGLPVSSNTLALKLQASQEALKRLQDQCFFLHDRLKKKDKVVEQTRAEASINAQALKKFIEENQNLATECANLLSQCSRWEKECSLYDRDIEALMEFGNEADYRAKEAEARIVELEDELRRLSEEVQFYKHECETHMANETRVTEELCLLRERMNELECLRLRPSTPNILSLVAELKTLQKDKEHLRINLHRAEEEVKMLFEENTVLDEANKKLASQCSRERHHQGSGGKHSNSASTKGNKRKSTTKIGNLSERLIDFNGTDSPRQPLSPLQHNSSDSRMHKK